MTTSPPETAETVLLDTSTLIAGRPIPGKVNTISVVSVAELADGVHAARTPAERAVRLARLDAVASTFDPVPFDAAVARTYGRVAAAVRAAGRQSRPRLAGLFIAATAVTLNCPLVTLNPADFIGLESLLVVLPALS